MSDYLDVMHREIDVMRSCSYQINKLAGAFSVIRNIELSDQLYLIAKDISDAGDNINHAVAKEINGRVNASQERAENMIAACLAMNVLNGDEDGQQ